MAEHKINFKVRYTQDQSVSPLVENLKEFLTNFQKVAIVRRKKCLIELSSDQLVAQDNIFTGTLREVLVTITYTSIASERQISDIFEALCSQWCNMCKKLAASCWLMPVITDYYHGKKPFHYDVETKEFAFGTLPDMQHFVQHHHYQSQVQSELFCSFYHHHKRLILFITLTHNKCKAEELSQKIVIQYDNISRLVICDITSNDYVELFFQLNCPPFFYVERNNKNRKSCDDGSKVHEMGYRDKQWDRSLNFGCRCKNSFCCIKRIGRILTFKIVLRGKYRARCIVERLMHRCDKSTQFCYTYLKTVLPDKNLKNKELMFLSNRTEEPLQTMKEPVLFHCLYAWQLLFCRSLAIKDQINLKYQGHNTYRIDHWSFLIEKFHAYVHEDPEAFCSALFHVSDMLCRNDIFEFEDAMKVLFEYYCHNKQDIHLPEGMCLVRRLIITPSRMVLLPPTESFDNRVIREIQNAKEYMLRVSIQDDDFSKLTYAVQYQSQKAAFMSEVAGDVLKQGIRIGNRRYEFLASSSSQLREHGLWCYAKDCEDRTAASIRSWMGDFSKIQNVAKYMARMGQCFSTSDEAIQITLENCNVRCIKDIELKLDERKYIFSDGIGKISPNLADKVIAAKENNRNTQPGDLPQYQSSAFQIRFKGCKGMVAVDPTLEGSDIFVFRPSMEKFKCDSINKLEIVKISAPRTLYLNRPLITILEQLGVPAEVFLKLQRGMILDLTNSLIYEDKAATTLEHFMSLDIPFQSLRKSGICLTEDPFFRSLLIAIYQFSVNRLKTKARIAVPHQYGRNMLGVLDETGTLQYGQVFVQYSEDISLLESRTHILTETIVVTKNPCMHPGDVRKLEAVDVPALHHHKDCIVFPATGHRPHPDEMAGSDLDGDEYVVIWMPQLKFPADNFHPMDYPMTEEKRYFRPIEVEDLVNFLSEYIQNDNIGALAFAHLAWADSHKDGIFSPQCMEIARKYPYVLDFAKTGHSEQLSKEERRRSYPDFMEKGSRSNTYRSHKVLGVLYRFVKNLEACVSKADLTCYNVRRDSLLEYPGWERYRDSAEEHKIKYVARVNAILNKYKVNSEAEALTGYLENRAHGNHKLRELEDISLIVKKFLKDTMKRYRYVFWRELDMESVRENLTATEKKKRLYQKASAWYMVTYGSDSCTILSFPWILSDILAEIRTVSCNIQNIELSPIKSSLLLSLDKSLLQNMCQDFQLDCSCVMVIKSVLWNWIITCNSSLHIFASKDPCFNCINRILTHFQRFHKRCCSWAEDCCSCSAGHCSPMEYIMMFMRFYLSNRTDLGRCESISKCSGFLDHNLQTAALQTYANLAVTRSDQYLGLDLSLDATPCHLNSNIEGDPVRISVSSKLKNFIQTNLDKMKIVLKSITGVKDIQMTIEVEQRDNHYILISATGTNWQRWALEELIMQPEITEILESKLQSQP